MKYLVFAMAAMLGLAAVPASAELKVGDPAPDFRCRPPTARLTSCPTSRASRPSSSPGSRRRSPGLHHRVQVARRQRREDQQVRRRLLHGQRRPARGREGQQGLRQVGERRLPAAQRPDQGHGQRLRRAQRPRLHQPLDLLHRQGRARSGHRQGCRATRPRRPPRTWSPSSASSEGSRARARPPVITPQRGPAGDRQSPARASTSHIPTSARVRARRSPRRIASAHVRAHGERLTSDWRLVIAD